MASPAKLASKQIHLELASSFENLELAVEKTQAFMAAITDDDELAYRVVLLTSEAVTNAMEHGNGYDPQKKVLLDITATRELIEVVVEDEGQGFDRADVDHPLEEGHLLDDGGRGLFLMDHMADEVTLEEGGRRLRMQFRSAP